MMLETDGWRSLLQSSEMNEEGHVAEKLAK